MHPKAVEAFVRRVGRLLDVYVHVAAEIPDDQPVERISTGRGVLQITPAVLCRRRRARTPPLDALCYHKDVSKWQGFLRKFIGSLQG